jgi:hypothetical protein
MGNLTYGAAPKASAELKTPPAMLARKPFLA